ncbi:MAG: thiol-disulfide oxidoreductase DCC family protein [Bacteroidota bacterium]
MEKTTHIPSNHPIVLFDGVCNLCNSSVQFLIERDPERHFRFASLQSEVGQSLLKQHGLPAEHLSSVVLIEDGHAYTHSDAPLRATRHMSGLWPAMGVFRILPRFLRDAVYNWIARNRYRWFGKQESCWLPRPELKQLFLD